MAETKRENWEIDRDREEIADILARFRKVTRRKIADTLYSRRTAEYRQALAELDALDENANIPNAPPPPYRLTRQMIDYDIKAIRAEWRRDYRQKFDDHISAQLASAVQLEKLAHEGYDRSIGEINDLQEDTETVELKTTIGELLSHVDETLAGLFSTKDLTKKITLPGARKLKRKRKKAQLIGDPRFLLVVDKAQQRIDNLLSLNAAQEVNVNTPGGANVVLVAGYDPAQWDASAAERTRAQAQRAQQEEDDAARS